MKILKRERLEEMPFDHEFNGQMCHSTGYEVLFEGDNVWWNEYVNDEGEYEYGN